MVTKTRRGRAAPPRVQKRRRRSNGFPTGAAVVVVVATLLVLVVAGRGDSDRERTSSVGGDLAHVHGLGINPANGDLHAATHYGVFRIPPKGKAERVGKLVQDTMGFTVVGPDHFLGSGHPDINDRTLRKPGRPPLLGLIESTNGGRSWRSVSLLGEADFHSLVAAHGNVYGYDSTGGRFMVSADGKQWETRSGVALADFAVDPGDADHVVASTEQGLAESGDGGRSWKPIDGPRLASLSWSDEQGLWGVSPAGETYRRVELRWEPRGRLTGEPQALLVTGDEIYVATSSGDRTAVYVSSDGGRSWRLRHSSNRAYNQSGMGANRTLVLEESITELFFAGPSVAGRSPTARRGSHPGAVSGSLDKPTRRRTAVVGRPGDAPEAGSPVRP